MAFSGHKLHDQEIRTEPHVAKYSTTGTGVEITTRLRVITGWSLACANANGANDRLFMDETITDFGHVVVSGGAVTISRAGSGTSGLVISVVLWGY